MKALSDGRRHEPTAGDVRRLRAARSGARAEVRAIETTRNVAMLVAFRREIGAVVRVASPLLISLLADEGMELDDACLSIEPQQGWPARPRLSQSFKKEPQAHTHLLRHYIAGLPQEAPRRPVLGGHLVERKDGGWFCIDVVNHSLEVSAMIGPVTLTTRYGELYVGFADRIPETILAGSVGRLVEEIVDHAALRGRGWRIVAIEDPEWPEVRSTLVVATGTVDFRLPWAR